MRQRWTISEEEIIRKYCKTKTDSEISKILGRNPQVVAEKRYSMNLKKNRCHWSRKEDELLKSCSNENLWLTAKEAMKKILPHRTIDGIETRRYFLDFHPLHSQRKIKGSPVLTKEKEICPICHSEFLRTFSKQKYCSQKCQREGCSRIRTKKRNLIIEEFGAKIRELYAQNYSLKEIAKVIGISQTRILTIKNWMHLKREVKEVLKRIHKKKSYVCRNCNQSFTHSASWFGITFCSKKCQQENSIRKEKRICKGCRKSFLTTPSSKRTYCSHSCHLPTIEVECPNCHIKHQRIPSQKERKFCNQKCYFEYLHKNKNPKFVSQPMMIGLTPKMVTFLKSKSNKALYMRSLLEKDMKKEEK